MTLLKDKKVLKRDFLRALGTGDEVLSHARRMGEGIVAEARAEAASVREEARRAGFEEGKAAAAGIMIRSKAHEEAVRRDERRLVIELAVEAASLIVKEARDLDPSVVEEAYRDALALAESAGRVTLRVAPADLARAKTFLEGSGAVSVVADGALSPGGCVVETDIGVIDGRIETQLEAIRRALGVAEDGHGRAG